MIGTLIGDLAAWTYENDQDTFWRQLIPNKGHVAKPSVYGHALMQAAGNNIIPFHWEKPTVTGTSSDGCRYFGQWLMWKIVGAWIDKSELSYMPEFLSIDKEESYACMFITELIKLLRHGATKSEAYHSVESFEDMSKSWDWRTPGEHLGLLTYIFRAWNAFYLASDYTSTIHNAVQWPDDRHLTCALAGTFADAMYGCNFNMIKKKYAKDGETSHFFGVLSTGQDYGYHRDLTMEMAECSRVNRSFIAKNNVLTNVEKNYWKKCYIDFDRIFLNDDRKKIWKSDMTSFDNRYGIYLDDGWLYCFRSGIQILRFKLEQISPENIYKIQNVMITDVMNFSESMKALCYTLEKTCKVSGYTSKEYNKLKKDELIKNCLYYDGYDENVSQNMFWGYEKIWVERSLLGETFDEYIDEFKFAGLDSFRKNDGTPTSLKALLFNRFGHFSSAPMKVAAQDFKNFYVEKYRKEYVNLSKNDSDNLIESDDIPYYTSLHKEPDMRWTGEKNPPSICDICLNREPDGGCKKHTFRELRRALKLEKCPDFEEMKCDSQMNFSDLLRLCYYYKGEEHIPKECHEIQAGKFWHAEHFACRCINRINSADDKKMKFYEMVALYIQKWDTYGWVETVNAYLDCVPEFKDEILRRIAI